MLCVYIYVRLVQLEKCEPMPCGFSFSCATEQRRAQTNNMFDGFHRHKNIRTVRLSYTSAISSYSEWLSVVALSMTKMNCMFQFVWNCWRGQSVFDCRARVLKFPCFSIHWVAWRVVGLTENKYNNNKSYRLLVHWNQLYAVLNNRKIKQCDLTVEFIE